MFPTYPFELCNRLASVFEATNFEWRRKKSGTLK